jgi:gliding motility-associated-like protein
MNTLFKIFLLALSLSFTASLAAQDQCATATPLGTVTSYCSNTGQFNNSTATPDAPTPVCFSGSNQGVWFSFIATGVNVNINVSGNTSPIPGGTLNSPQIALYSGNCTSLTPVACRSDAFGFDVVELFASNLVLGQVYYFMVDGRGNNRGTFKLCVNNYNPVVEPSSDCPTGVVLCDKTGFTVPSISGSGSNSNELNNVCPGSCTGGISEDNSAWYKWTCRDAGTFSFTISPLNPSDDIDFYLFELPNGLNNCSGKQPIRCNSAGENQGSPLSTWIACTGPTGMRLGESDTNEPCGCNGGNNNYVAAANLVAGRSYALAIQNFSGTGSGFSIEFGGSATFLGPEADFVIDQAGLCDGLPITVIDNSTFAVGTITDWSWNFGPGSNPGTANTVGPHQVQYTAPGVRTVRLTIETDLGCIVTKTLPVTIGEPVNITASTTNVPCFNDNIGTINVTPAPHVLALSYLWSNGAVTQDLANLGPGTYTVTVSNSICQTIETYDITGPPPFVIEDSMTLATCNGGTDGALYLDVSGAVPFWNGGYLYDWGLGFQASPQSLNLPIGLYAVTIRDSIGCEVDLNLEVRELELLLDPGASTLVNPSCYGFANGSISLGVGNGLGPFAYDWGPVNNFVLNDNFRNNLTAGDYIIRFRDANFCFGLDTISLVQPDSLQIVLLDSVDIRCFGEDNGQAIPVVIGGTYPYAYLWSDPLAQTDSLAVNLEPGPIALTVTDANGCIAIDTTTIIEPPLLEILAVYPNNALCYGETNGGIGVWATGGTPAYQYGIVGGTLGPDTLIANIGFGVYDVQVVDSRGCETTWENVFIDQPFQLIVDAGLDRTINLGDTTELYANVNSAWVSQYSWTPITGLFCPNCKITGARPVQSTTYTVLVTDDFGCTATDDVTISVDVVRPVFIPNAFTPNVDGLNDTFHPFGGSSVLRVNQMAIFDRWGELVYRADNFGINDPSSGWDGTFNGKVMNAGVFVYLIEIEFIDGVKQSYQGDVNLIR